MSPPNHNSGTDNDTYQSEEVQKKCEIANEVEIQHFDPIEERSNSSDGDPEPTVIVPPDGGWGWVVVLASFMCNVVVDGIIFSFGMFLTDISGAMGVTKAQVSLVGSLLSGFYLIVGPFVSALANKYGFRAVTMCGGVLASLAFVASSFATNIEFLYITYGIIGGIGFGFIYVPSVIVVGFYFERWRALATGIAVCGSGIGTFVLSPLTAMLIEKIGWSNALLVQAAIVLSCTFFGAAFRPIQPIKLSLDTESESETSSTQEKKETEEQPEYPLIARIKVLRDEAFIKGHTVHAFRHHHTTHASFYHHYPTAEEVFAKGIVKHQDGISNISLNANGELKHPTVALLSIAEKPYSGSDESYNTPVFENNIKLAVESKNAAKIKARNEREVSEPLLDGDSTLVGVPYNQERRHTISGRRQRTNSETGNAEKRRARRGTIQGEEIQRPFYRDDIFFSASLKRIPQYTSHTSLGYHMAVTRLPTKSDIREENENHCKICPEAVRRTLNTMLDFSLLRSPTFLILASSGFLTMMGFYIPFMFVKDRAVLLGMDINLSMWLVSSIGIMNTVGRVACGVMTSFPGLNALMINNAAMTISGVATLFSGLSSSDEYQFVYACIFGLSVSCFASLRSILVVDLLGLEKLTNAFGLILLFQGISATIGAPMAGAFLDATGSYDISFYLSGALITVSAVMCYPLGYINRWEKENLRGKNKLANV